MERREERRLELQTLWLKSNEMTVEDQVTRGIVPKICTISKYQCEIGISEAERKNSRASKYWSSSKNV